MITRGNHRVDASHGCDDCILVTDIDCDFSVASPGDPCAFAGSQSCSGDGKTRLTCVAGSYGAPVACQGPKGCKYIDRGARREKAECDGASAGASRGKD